MTTPPLVVRRPRMPWLAVAAALTFATAVQHPSWANASGKGRESHAAPRSTTAARPTPPPKAVPRPDRTARSAKRTAAPHRLRGLRPDTDRIKELRGLERANSVTGEARGPLGRRVQGLGPASTGLQGSGRSDARTPRRPRRVDPFGTLAGERRVPVQDPKAKAAVPAVPWRLGGGAPGGSGGAGMPVLRGSSGAWREVGRAQPRMMLESHRSGEMAMEAIQNRIQEVAVDQLEQRSREQANRTRVELDGPIEVEAEGKRSRFYPDGTTEVEHEDGTFERVGPNGEREVHYSDGSVEIHRPDGSGERYGPNGAGESFAGEDGAQADRSDSSEERDSADETSSAGSGDTQGEGGSGSGDADGDSGNGSGDDGSDDGSDGDNRNDEAGSTENDGTGSDRERPAGSLRPECDGRGRIAAPGTTDACGPSEEERERDRRNKRQKLGRIPTGQPVPDSAGSQGNGCGSRDPATGECRRMGGRAGTVDPGGEGILERRELGPARSLADVMRERTDPRVNPPQP